MTDESRLELIYVADAMCSWCYGFAPVIDRLHGELKDRASLRLIQGGLRPAAYAAAVDDEMKEYLRHHWEQVAERSGQPFDHAFFSETGRLYDTEPAAVACVAMRRHAPESEMAYFHSIQSAFYARNHDITQSAVLAELAEPYVEDADAFASALGDQEVIDATHSDYEFARRLGVRGFPTLIVGTGSGMQVLAAGYSSYEDVRLRLDALLPS